MSIASSPLASSARFGMAKSCPSPGTVRVTLVGDVDFATAGLLQTDLLNVLAAQQPDRLEIDLAGVAFMDCGGISALVVARAAAARIGCHLQVTNPQPVVLRVLDLTGLLGVLTADPLAPAGTAARAPEPAGRL
jgi:anti-anti-sigma factor